MAVLAANSSHIVLHSGLWERTRQQRWQQQRHGRGRHTHTSGGGDGGTSCSSSGVSGWYGSTKKELGRKGEGRAWVGAFWMSKPSSVEMEPIADCETLDLVLRLAQELSQPIVIEWMASWCRKCIYLKPKLEKLAAEHYSKREQSSTSSSEAGQHLENANHPALEGWGDERRNNWGAQSVVGGGRSERDDPQAHMKGNS